MLKTPLKFLITIILTLGLSMSFQSLLATWDPPSAPPPSPNVPEPINSGADEQTKNGRLNLGELNIAGHTYTDGNLWFSDGTRYLGTADNNHLRIRTNNVNRLTITNTGDIGIGTTNPVGALLHVNGNIRASDPTQSYHVATKNYVDSILPSGGGSLSCYANYVAGWTPTDIATNSRCNAGYELVGFNTSGRNGLDVIGGYTGNVWAWQFCCKAEGITASVTDENELYATISTAGSLHSNNYGISSVSIISTGRFRVFFDSPISTTDYLVLCTTEHSAFEDNGCYVRQRNTAYVDIQTFRIMGGGTETPEAFKFNILIKK